MAGPWEAYQQPQAAPAAADGPWANYASPQAGTAAPQPSDLPVTDLPAVRAYMDISSWPDDKINFPQTPNAGLLDYIKAVRPEYATIPDKDLVWAAHRAIYPDVSPVEFLRATGYAEKVGLKPEEIATGGEQAVAGMSGFERFKAGAGQSVASTGRGIAQLAGLLSREDVDAARQADAPLLRTGAGLSGAITGNVAQIVAPGGALKLGAKVPQLSRAAPALDAAGSAFLPSTVRGAAASGAGFGAVQEVGTGDSRAGNIALGGLAGTLGAALPRAATAVTERAARLSPAFTQGQQERAAAEVLEQFASNPDAVRRALSTSQVLVQGTRPTLAEATEDAGLAGLQKFMGNRPELQPALRETAEANNAARVKAIEDAFGGADAATIDRLTGARDLAARQILRPISNISLKDVTPVNNAVDRLIVKNASAKNVREALGAVKEEIGTIKTVQDAHNVRQYIDQLISGQVEGRAGAKFAQRELMTVKDVLDRQMRQAYPEWGKFLREYKAASKEIGQVKVGNRLLDKGPNISGVGDIPVLSPDKFSGAAADMDRLAAQATGFRRARAENIVTQQQSKVVDEVRRDLERFSRSNSRAAPIAGGSATMQNAVGGTRVQDALGPVGATMIEPVSGAALLFLNAARKNYGEKVAGIVNEAILSPDRAAEILARLPPKSRRAITRQVAPFLNQAGSVSGRTAPALIQD
jgi:hypothetical protein